MALLHGVRSLLDENADLSVLLWLAFIPARYDTALAHSLQFPGGIGADIWTFVTYSFLHAEILHIAVNLVWLLAFGSAVAWRFGAVRFLLFFAAASAAGAGAFLFTHFGDLVPLVGASGAISGAMAAACRFVFADEGPLGVFRGRDRGAYLVPAVPLREALKNRRVVAFLAVWFALNFLFGLSAVTENFTNATVAWEAHLGGFLAGLLLFRFFDPVPRLSSSAPLAPRGGEEDD
jgi:membrane associated rhomboid family serine protease